MVNHCVVGGCNNREGRDKSTRRDFLVFHKCPKNPLRRATWDKRINRCDKDVKKLSHSVYRVCSDHFNDCDYQLRSWYLYLKSGLAKGMKLNGSCIPNTDPVTGAISLYIPGQPPAKEPRRTLWRLKPEVFSQPDLKPEIIHEPESESSNVEEIDDDKDVKPEIIHKPESESSNMEEIDDDKDVKPEIIHKPEFEFSNMEEIDRDRDLKPEIIYKPDESSNMEENDFDRDVKPEIARKLDESSNIKEINCDTDRDDYWQYLVDYLPQRHAQTQTSDYD